MAYEIPGFKLGVLPANADLSAKQYYGVKVVSGGIDVVSAAGGVAVGILQNKPVSGEAAEVTVLGVSKAIGSGALSKGALVAFDSNGKLKAAVLGKTDTSDAGAAADPLLGSHVIGILLEDCAADLALTTVLLLHLGAVPTTAS